MPGTMTFHKGQQRPLLAHERRQIVGSAAVQPMAAALPARPHPPQPHPLQPNPLPAHPLRSGANQLSGGFVQAAQSAAHSAAQPVVHPAVHPLVARPLLPHERRAVGVGPATPSVVLPALVPRSRALSLPARPVGMAEADPRAEATVRRAATERNGEARMLMRAFAQTSGRLLDLGVAMIDAAGSRARRTPAEESRRGGDRAVPGYRKYMHGTLLDVLETARYGHSLDPNRPGADAPSYRRFMGGTLVDLFEKMQGEREPGIDRDDPSGDGAGGAHARQKPSRLRREMHGTLVDLFDAMAERRAADEAADVASGDRGGRRPLTEAARPRSMSLDTGMKALEEPASQKRVDNGAERKVSDTLSRTSSEQSHEVDAVSSRSRASTMGASVADID